MSKKEFIAECPLDRKRRFLGTFVPVINISIFSMILFYTVSGLLAGLPILSIDFMSNLVIIVLSFFVGFYMPRNAPIYTSRYELSRDKLTIYRIYKKPVTLSFREIREVEVYVKSKGRIPREVIQQERMAIESLRKNGFKFLDYTNTEDIIILLITEEKVYMISPKEPEELIKKIKKYQPSLKGRLVELTDKGSRVKRI
ncbi:hypothetical protein KEJ47_02890 [Candidatus Bathyarchaeota archaeon]|nr:hypothetical protein [Candidatus Bathyarchaeota archaeon]